MAAAKVLFWHGYGLAHTGSNVYTYSLCRSLATLGHEVVLVCQERRRERFPEGVRVYVPDIGGVLPVYVLDRYEGFGVKRFLDLRHEELETYLRLNRRALGDILDKERPDVAHVDHAVVGPFMAASLLAEREIPLVVTVQGSDMLFAAGRSRLYRRLARIGLEAARVVVTLSRFGSEQARLTLGDPGWFADKNVLIPAGVNPDVFYPRDASASFKSLIRSFMDLSVAHSDGVGPADEGSLLAHVGGASGLYAELVEKFSARAPDRHAATKLERVLGSGTKPIVFVGNLMAGKGAQYLLAASPLILARQAKARVIIAGFGRFRLPMEGMLIALSRGDRQLALRFAEVIDSGLEPGSGAPRIGEVLKEAESLLRSDYWALGRSIGLLEKVVFTGMIEAAQSKFLLSMGAVAVVPSVMAESFGIVAVEAMASGVPALVTGQSALAELGQWQASATDLPADKLILPPDERLVSHMADSALFLLAMPDSLRKKVRRKLARSAAEAYSWPSVAERLSAIYLRTLS